MNETHTKELKKILESAKRLGVELNESEALQWLTSISAQSQSGIKMDERTGVFGHSVSMLDFDDEELAHFRKIGKLVEFEDLPGKVETALALSGSAAQSKIQTYPGDADYFERVNIIADTREEACQVLADLILEKALSTRKGETYQLMEVKFGSYPDDFHHSGVTQQKGSPISWSPEDLKSKQIKGQNDDGSEAVIRWEEAALDPGWCKLDWVVADPVRKQLVNARNGLGQTTSNLNRFPVR